MKTVNIGTLENQLSAYLRLVRDGAWECNERINKVLIICGLHPRIFASATKPLKAIPSIEARIAVDARPSLIDYPNRFAVI